MSKHSHVGDEASVYEFEEDVQSTSFSDCINIDEIFID